MMENKNTVNTEAVGKTFSQEEVNRIVSDRLARERDKRTAELDERENALKQRELAVIAREKLDAAGLNKELCGVLRYNDESELDEAITKLKTIKGFDGEKPEKSEKRKIIPNLLPVLRDSETEVDPFREAFKLPKE